MSNNDNAQKAPASMLTLTGTPLEIGTQVWTRICAPAVHAAAQTRPPQELIHLYCGFLMACMGSMAADMGHKGALEVAQLMVDSFATADIGEGKAH